MNDNMNPNYVYPPTEPPKEKNPTAITSMVLGIIGVVSICCCGVGAPVFGIAALICAIVSKSKTGKMNGMAIAGLIMGIVSIVFGVAWLIFFFVGMSNGGLDYSEFEEIFDDLYY